MRLTFRVQFALAPLVIVALLACLVGYTLLELSNLRKENDVTVKWELLTDHIQVAIANVSLTDKLVLELMAKPLSNDDERLFGYLEQTSILADSLIDSVYVDGLPEQMQQRMQRIESLLSEPERTAPIKIHSALLSLLPELQYQYKLYLAQRRSAFIDYHHNLSVIIPRLSGVLLTILIVCIVLAIGLTVWGLNVIRHRLRMLTRYAQSISSGDSVSLPEPSHVRDELDTFELSLARAAKRLINVVAVDKILQGAEKERHRIAMDIHDGVLADLTSLSRQIETLQSSLTEEQQHQLRSTTDDITQSLRDTIDDLHPQTLNILGLEAALRSFLNRQLAAKDSPSLQFNFDSVIDKNMPSSQKIQLFRIVSEAVQNVLRHARCKRFEISLRRLSKLIIVSVEDDGVGMPEQSDGLGHGCSNIIERARTMGATVVWRGSRFTSGTCFELMLPDNTS